MDIKIQAEQYAEKFRLESDDKGWYQQKVDDFTAGYEAALGQFSDMQLISNYNNALQAVYDHVGFKQLWVIYPIHDCTDKFWGVDNKHVKFADSEEQYNIVGDYSFNIWRCSYYIDNIYAQRFYSKYIYEGKKFTMIFCESLVDGSKWFRVFDNAKRLA